MGISLYYNVKRANALTVSEQKQIHELADRYNDEFEFKGESDQLTFYPNPPEDHILAGSLQIGYGNEENILPVIFYWLEGLSDMRNQVLHEAEWSVSLDDIEFVWDNVSGWQFEE